jgi:hypothetical protein
MSTGILSQVENAFIAGLAGAAAAAAVALVDVGLRECIAFDSAAELAMALAGLSATATILFPGVALLSGFVALLYGVPAGLLLRTVRLESGPFYLVAGAAGGWLIAAAFGWDGLDFLACCLADGCAAAWCYWRLLPQPGPAVAAPALAGVRARP